MKIIKPEVHIEHYDGIEIMKKIEQACRTCYRSENLMKEDSYKNLLKNCITRGHESVLEHEKITVQLICDIGVYKDLTRHRIASFSIESTRYCNYSKDKFDNEIKFIEPVFFDGETEIFDSFDDKAFVFDDSEGNTVVSNKSDYIKVNKNRQKSYLWYNSMKDIEQTYNAMAELKCTPDEMRMILPHSTAALVTMTANIREWKHILSLRATKHAHPAVQQVMIPILLNFKKEMPEIFDSIEYNTEFDPDKYAETCYYIIN